MSMLAGPRRKQKVINLRAKNNAWSNDATKFGQRMLEKMGWNKGKGLGAKEDGIVEHIVARYKNDEKGLGYEDKNDQWTKHEDDFNALLANLSNSNDDEEKLHSGVSLEVKSKKSKARIHYHMFTRGKDIARYSEKDLANIFGKKILKEKQKEDENVQEEVRPTEKIFTEKGSMTDYFKAKLAALQSKTSNKTESDNTYSGLGYNSDTEDNYRGFGFNADSNDSSTVDNNYQGFGFWSATEAEKTLGNKNEEENIVKSKKSKKKTKPKCVIDGTESLEVFEKVSTEINAPVQKKKKKSKKHIDSNLEILNDERQEDTSSEKPKKKKSNNLKSYSNENIDSLETAQFEEKISKKKSKKQNLKQSVPYEEEEREGTAPKKKKKKNM